MIQSGNITFVPKQTRSQNKTPKEPPSENAKKLDELIRASSRVLFQTTSRFPFDLFPDEIIIYPKKITIIIREFFGSEQIYDIPIKEVSDVTADVTPFSGTLTITDNRYKDTPIVIKNLKKEAATRGRKIIQGLITATTEGIDLSKFETEELLEKIEELGKING